MEILRLPPEIIENIFLHLDTQTLASCALADSHLADIVYSSHFLDEYCRTSLNCSWITSADIYNAPIAVPYEFWFWLYTTMKLENTGETNLIFHNQHLTKIGTFRHMFIMWLMCGLRPSFMYSHTLMYELYPLPETVTQLYRQTNHLSTSVNDVLMKIFLALPEIMELSCCSLELLKMQSGYCTSLYMDIVCNDGIQPKLPLDFTTMFSIEIISSPLFGKNPSLLILIGSETWIMWLGFLNITFDHNETSIVENLFCKYFNNEANIIDIQLTAKAAVQDLNSFVYSLRNGSPCPIISADHPDMATVNIFLAQEHHRSLQQAFGLALDKHCCHLIKSVTSKNRGDAHCKEAMMDVFNIKLCENAQINEYILNVINVDKTNDLRHLSFIIYKCVLECVACLFRNEIHFCVEDSFCHSFLCGCLGPPFKNTDSESVETKLEKCLAEKMKDGLYPPQMWPAHVLSAARQVVPVLTELLEMDIMMVTSRSMKCVIPKLVLMRINQRLQNAGLTLTNRPPNKPRCPPLLKQVRLWSVENVS
ncbi:hypothetical protein BgiBS90_006636 [Biomphalaria glabrata]|nr:hypothetical protein BgiBS90_006636 [Biomphalaria glabrata]